MRKHGFGLFLAIFALGASAGFLTSKYFSATHSNATTSAMSLDNPRPDVEMRLDRLDTRLTELATTLTQMTEALAKADGPLEHTSTTNTALGAADGGRRVGSPPEKTLAAEEIEATKARVLNSLHHPTTNFASLMASTDMQRLPKRQQDAVLREIAARLETGQLNKEQFLPGYRERAMETRQ